MLGSIFKLSFSLGVFLLVIALFLQTSMIDGTPVLAENGNSLKSTETLLPGSMKLSRAGKKNYRKAKRVRTWMDNRLKRFRMLDQDEFQEMLKSLSQSTSDDQSKVSNAMDSIGGMQLANYWSH